MSEFNNHTVKEIWHQPKMWLDSYDIVLANRRKIEEFLVSNGIGKDTGIVLTGAGTSDFIADAAACLWTRSGYSRVKAVATTDIVSSCGYFLDPSDRLFISFGRSGNSPESVAAWKIARAWCRNASHLIITCNPEGELVKCADPERDLAIVLPDGTNDRSLAMTSSFSSMLITSILCKNVAFIERERARLKAAADFASHILEDAVTGRLKELASKKFSRAVFLGSGPLKGIACECHLKLQELTDGQIMCAYDSFMGLRHGPQAVINEDTLVVYLLSEDPYVRRYELDLVAQVYGENHPAAQVIVSTVPSGMTEGVDFEIDAPASEELLEGEYRFVPYVLVGQLLGYYSSLAKGLDPDNPSAARGAISRVVHGVTIYDFPEDGQ